MIARKAGGASVAQWWLMIDLERLGFRIDEDALRKYEDETLRDDVEEGLLRINGASVEFSAFMSDMNTATQTCSLVELVELEISCASDDDAKERLLDLRKALAEALDKVDRALA